MSENNCFGLRMGEEILKALEGIVLIEESVKKGEIGF